MRETEEDEYHILITALRLLHSKIIIIEGNSLG
jgi:hypothetical protein